MTKNQIDLLDRLDKSALSQEEQEEILLDLHDVVYKAVLIRIIGSMNENMQSRFNEYLDSSPDEEAVLSYIYEKVPEADAIVASVLEEIQSDILGTTNIK